LEVKRIALMQEQVEEWNLPPAPAKLTDSRTANWDGLGQVELDAVEPNKLMGLVQEAIDGIFDEELFEELQEEERQEQKKYTRTLKKYVTNLEFPADDEDDEE